MDPCSDNEETWHSSTATLRSSQHSTLERDVNLLRCMQEFSEKMVLKTTRLVRELDCLERDSISSCVRVDNCLQSLNLISTKQYMEKRVYDEEIKEPAKEVIQTEPSQPSDSHEFIKRIKTALGYVIPVLRRNEGGDNPPLERYQQVDENMCYTSRPLPHIVGSEDFIMCPTVGLPHHEDYPEDAAIIPYSELQNNGRSRLSSSYSSDNVERKQPILEPPDQISKIGSEEPETVSPEADDTETRPIPSMYNFQKELAMRFKIPQGVHESSQWQSVEIHREEEERVGSWKSETSKQVITTGKPDLFSDPPVLCQPQRVIEKRRNLFDSSESDEDDLFKSASQSSAPNISADQCSVIQHPVSRSNDAPPDLLPVFAAPKAPNPQIASAPTPARVGPPVAGPVSRPVPSPATVSSPSSKNATSNPVRAADPVSRRQIQPQNTQVSTSNPINALKDPSKMNNGIAARLALFESDSDDDDDLFASSKPIIKPIPKPSAVESRDEDEDIFTSGVKSTQKKSEKKPVPVKSVPASQAPSKSLFEDDDEDFVPFPTKVEAKKSSTTPVTTQPTASRPPAAVPNAGSFLFQDSDSDSDDDIFRTIQPPIIEKRDEQLRKAVVSPENPSRFQPTPFASVFQKADPVPVLASRPSDLGDGPITTPPPRVTAEPAKQNSRVEKSSSQMIARSSILDDDSDSDLFTHVRTKSPPADPSGGPKADESLEDEEKTPGKSVASRKGNLIASLQVSLAKQPMGMLGGLPGAAFRPPIGGVAIMSVRSPEPGPALDSPSNLYSPPTVGSPPALHLPGDLGNAVGVACQESLPCLGKDRPRPNTKRKLPTRNHRRSMMSDVDGIVELIRPDAEKQIVNGHVPAATTERPPAERGVVDSAHQSDWPELDTKVAELGRHSDDPLGETAAEMAKESDPFDFDLSNDAADEIPADSGTEGDGIEWESSEAIGDASLEIPEAPLDHQLASGCSSPIEDIVSDCRTETAADNSSDGADSSDEIPYDPTASEPASRTWDLSSDSDSEIESEPPVPDALQFQNVPKDVAVRTHSSGTAISSLFSDSDSSDDELFAPIPKTGPPDPKPPLTQPDTDQTAPSAASVTAPVTKSANLFSEDSDSDDGLFSSRPIVTPLANVGLKPSPTFDDSDDDDLFSSQSKNAAPSARSRPSGGDGGPTGTIGIPVTSDPLLGSH